VAQYPNVMRPSSLPLISADDHSARMSLNPPLLCDAALLFDAEAGGERTDVKVNLVRDLGSLFVLPARTSMGGMISSSCVNERWTQIRGCSHARAR
jgi:hypothetical protein